ncbi:CASP-like protein [Platanthera zijinensis]|uniref:CASP-like protein n=1 Tax=Platanthera zijinensis TaxID=2320716 RepID=A0AAP0G5Q8_9ASPA
MEEQQAEAKTRKNFMKVQFALRSSAALCALSAAVVMAVNRQTISLSGFQITASFAIASSLKFFVAGNFVCSGYLLLSLPLVHALGSSFLHYVADLMTIAVTISAASVGAVIGQLGKEGNDMIGWAEICSTFQRFCDHAEASIALSFGAFFLLFISSALSVFALQTGKHEK